MIPLSIPNIGEAEKAAVAAALEEGWVSTAGPYSGRFEEAVRALTGSRFAVAVANGSAALFLALRAAGVREGDLVPLNNLTFVASANAVTHCGAEPVLVDLSYDDWQMDLNLLEGFLREECCPTPEGLIHIESGRRVPAVLAVHVLGYVGDMERLAALCDELGVALIEDAAEAVGAVRNGKHAGTFGKAGCLSFNGNKIVTAGAGGMVLTDDPQLEKRVRHLAAQARAHNREYLHDDYGYNLGLSAMNAALGTAQLGRLDAFLEAKKRIDRYYRMELGRIDGLEMPPLGGDHQPNFWMFTILSEESRQLEEVLEVKGIDSRKLWVPLSRQGIYSSCRYLRGGDNSFDVYDRSLSLPCSTGIESVQLELVVEAVREFFSR